MSDIARALILGLAISVVSCGKQRSTTSTMTTTEAKELSDALARLDGILKAKAPSIHANLNGAASSDDLAQLRSVLDGNTVEALENWFSWHNGASGKWSRMLPLGFPLSVSDALNNRKMLNGIPLID